MELSELQTMAEPQCLEFFTYDWGERPYKVVLVGGSVVAVYIKSDPKSETYDKRVLRFANVKRFMIGRDATGGYPGNSILLSMADGRYIFIGDRVYSFTTPNGDVIRKYYSLLGNSGVPYPVAVGIQNIYFMLGSNSGPALYVPRRMFDKDTDWMDAYRVFYAQTEDKTSEFSKSVCKVPKFQTLLQRVKH